jgi:hypothetical protein
MRRDHASTRSPSGTVRPLVAWIALVVIALVVIGHLGRGTTFFYDEWNFVLGRRSGGLDAFLEPHNGHLSLLPVALYRGLFDTFGLQHYAPYRFAGAFVHATVASLVALLVGRRTANAWVGVAAGSVVLLLGTGWQNILWPFQVGFMGSVAATLGVMLCLEARSRPGDVAAAALLTIALACSGLGVPATIAATVMLLCQRSSLRRFAVVAIPTVVYGLWYVTYGEPQARASNLNSAPRYIANAAAGAFMALGDLSLRTGRVVLVLAIVGLVIAVWRRRGISATGAGAFVFLLSFWTLTALSRAEVGTPLASRYVYVGAVFLVVLTAEALPPLPGFVPAVLSLCLAMLVIWGNAAVFRRGAGGLRETSAVVGAELAVAEQHGAAANGWLVLDSQRAPALSLGAYLAAVADLGSPAPPMAALPHLPPIARSEADRVALMLAPPIVSSGLPAVGGPPPTLADPAEPAPGLPACVLTAPGVPAIADVPDTGLFIRGDLPVSLTYMRFGDVPLTANPETIDPGEPVLNPPRADAVKLPWRVEVDSPTPVLVCSAA